MTDEPGWLAALMMGFFGSVHCIAMCGGIAGALGQALPASEPWRMFARQLGYSAGRISSYACAGALAGGFGLLVGQALGPSGALLLRGLCGALLIASGVWIAGGWAGITRLESIGAHLWRHLAPLSRRLTPADRAWKLWGLGAIWGWLPCGLVYAALGGAAARGSAVAGALWMTVFGLGTLPALLATGTFALGLRRVSEGRRTRRFAGALLVAFGIWTLLAVLFVPHAGHSPAPDPHGPHPHAEHAMESSFLRSR